jgi:hypothetical protein
VFIVFILCVLGVLFAIVSSKRRAQAMEFLTGRRPSETDDGNDSNLL